MKSRRLMTLLLAISGVSAPSIAVAQYQPPLAPPGMMDPLAGADPIRAIQRAPDPSSAVNAFAAAHAADRTNPLVEDAYMRRMIEFGLPEMSDAQSQDLVRRNPGNGLAWAVAAYMSAKRDDLRNAASQIDFAAQRAPDDPFVVRTAAQVVAWHDLKSTEGILPDVVRLSVEAVRRQESAQLGYDEAYQQATQILKDRAAQPAPPPGGAPVLNAPLPPAPPADSVPPLDVAPPLAPDYGPLVYDPPVYPVPYPDYYPGPYDYGYAGVGSSRFWYPGYYDGCPSWWPCGGGFFVLSGNRGFHRGHDVRHGSNHDGHHDGTGRPVTGTTPGTGVATGGGVRSAPGRVARGTVPFAAALPQSTPVTQLPAVSVRPTAVTARSNPNGVNSRQAAVSSRQGSSAAPKVITIDGSTSPGSRTVGTSARNGSSAGAITVIRGDSSGGSSKSIGASVSTTGAQPRIYVPPSAASSRSSTPAPSFSQAPAQVNTRSMPSSSGVSSGARSAGSVGWRSTPSQSSGGGNASSGGGSSSNSSAGSGSRSSNGGGRR